MNPIQTGRFIRQQRQRLNLSQSKLAEMLCVEPQTVSKWERGLGMPDYDNIDKLREIFGCTLSEILEPCFEDEGDSAAEDERNEGSETNLPVIIEVIGEEERNSKKRSFRILDFLSKKKIKELLERMFGYEYANTYNESFLFKNVLKRRSKEQYETTLTQGMFRGKTSHSVIGLEAPWLYLKLFFFLLICAGIAFIPAAMGLPMPFVIIGGLFSALPLMMFLFESNFARNLSLVDVLGMFTVGGLCSIALTLITTPTYPIGKFLSSVVLAPVIEELAKALLVVIFVAKAKPKNMLTGLLIGFSVGAGFSFFENIHYAYNISILGAFTGDVEFMLYGPIGNIILRTLNDFVMGHHYWTAIFGAVYVLFKKKAEFNLGELFQGKVLLSLLFSMLLHATWNGSSFLSIPFFPFLLQTLVCVLSVTSLIVLINIGIAQARILGILEDYQNEHSDKGA